MIIIADSGSTKTDWRVLNRNGSISQAKTIGFNPYYISTDKITEELNSSLLPQINGIPSKIYYYGAGCSSEQNKNDVKQALHNVWNNVEIEVGHDLLAAARALCLDEEGIACILGTGSNSCYYNGDNIVENIPSLGYVLGDEGSGAYMGKKLLQGYFRGTMPQPIVDRIVKRFGISLEEVLQKTYKEPMPNRFMASFAKFIFQNIKDPYLYRLVHQCFTDFFEQNIMLYENYENQKIHFTGSIAFYFSNILRQVAAEKQVTVKNIIESPIAGLTLYHQKQL